MDNQTDNFVQAIAKARPIAQQHNQVELINPSCDAEEWALCEALLEAFQYDLASVAKGKWQASLSSMNIEAIGKSPREAILRCFFDHMEKQTEVF